ncbi:MAG: SCO4848 family membrane protein, partial [Mycobacteriales bacterium]
MSRRISAFLILVAAWNVVIWAAFLRMIVRSDRAFADGRPTNYFKVHVVLGGVSLMLAVAVAVIGWRGWRTSRSALSGEGAFRNFLGTGVPRGGPRR